MVGSDVGTPLEGAGGGSVATSLTSGGHDTKVWTNVGTPLEGAGGGSVAIPLTSGGPRYQGREGCVGGREVRAVLLRAFVQGHSLTIDARKARHVASLPRGS